MSHARPARHDPYVRPSQSHASSSSHSSSSSSARQPLRRRGQWFFERRELERTPSRRDNVAWKDEELFRMKGVKFIVEVAIQLRLYPLPCMGSKSSSGTGAARMLWSVSFMKFLNSRLQRPQVTVSAAATFFHRFYMRHSIKKHHHYDVAGTCLFLSCKTEEMSRKLTEVAKACAKIAQKNRTYENQNEFEKWRTLILAKEPIVLAAICFEMNLENPYRILIDRVRRLKLTEKDKAKNLAIQAWAIVNDSYRTPLCLLHPPKVVVSASVFLAAKMSQVELNDDPQKGRVWWQLMYDDIGAISDAVDLILDNYLKHKDLVKETKKPVTSSRH